MLFRSTTADHPAWHIGFWMSQFRVSGFDIENGLRPWDVSVLDIVVPLVMLPSYLLLIVEGGLHREGGEIAKPRRVILGWLGAFIDL